MSLWLKIGLVSALCVCLYATATHETWGKWGLLLIVVPPLAGWLVSWDHRRQHPDEPD